jgi:acetylornithine/succinyldiaminopimelate/putrescine aminotransferase
VSAIDRLHELQRAAGERQTVGLPDDVVSRFLATDPRLVDAIERAVDAHQAMAAEWGELLRGSEDELVRALQEDFVNFYEPSTVNPYVPLAGRGPWIVTTHGAVLHDDGGYGMLGAGHAPEFVLEAMAQPHVMANVMTPSFTHKRFADRLKREVGQRRGACPFSRFICMNSGSESVSVAARISDINAHKHVAAGGRRAGAKVKFLALRGAFHGRTDRPAQASHSSAPKYHANLHSFQSLNNLEIVEANDVAGLRAAFAAAEANGVFFEAMLLEPVMGEGNPGQAISRAFYDAARELTLAHGSLLIVDSIQAGIRCTGYLSIVDYPGFEDCIAPDIETYSKAINAGQYPLSVLALTERAAAIYVTGVYGNTMTTNPKALEVGCAVLDALTPALRENIRARGEQLVAGLTTLMEEFPGVVTKVQGTGLLVSAEIDPRAAAVVGHHGLETWCRKHGLGVIHGGKNALRFTPAFSITAPEIALIVDVVRQSLVAATSGAAIAAEALRAPAHAAAH